jgi:hypothetical protein
MVVCVGPFPSLTSEPQFFAGLGGSGARRDAGRSQ